MRTLNNFNKNKQQIKNCISLPYINSSQNKFIIRTNPSKNFINSNLVTQKYKLDVQKYRANIITKKKKFDFIQKECEQLKERGKSSDRIIYNPLMESNRIQMNLKDNTEFLESEKERGEYKVKNYKETKNNLDLCRKEYNSRNDENNKIKNDIYIITKEIIDIENKINERNNDVKYIKSKIELSEKNNISLKKILENCKEKNETKIEKIISILINIDYNIKKNRLKNVIEIWKNYNNQKAEDHKKIKIENIKDSEENINNNNGIKKENELKIKEDNYNNESKIYEKPQKEADINLIDNKDKEILPKETIESKESKGKENPLLINSNEQIEINNINYKEKENEDKGKEGQNEDNKKDDSLSSFFSFPSSLISFLIFSICFFTV